MLTVSFATGTEPGKWFRRFEELHSLSTVPADDPLTEPADLFLVRLPDSRVGEEHHVVRLYEEAWGVAVPKDSVYASVYAEAKEPVREGDLAGEIVNFEWSADGDPAGQVAELRAALQVVAANVGVAYAPLPLLKALSKKQVVPLAAAGPGEAASQTAVGLVWLKEHDSEVIQDFVGVAKGRTVRSSRSSAGNAGKPQPRNRRRGRRPR